MKTKATLIILFLTMVVISAWSYYSDDFLIGGFLDNKTRYEYNFHAQMRDIMREGGFTAGKSQAVYDETNAVTVEQMLSQMNGVDSTGIDAMLEDCIFDTTSASPVYGAWALSMGCYFRFEAEYADSASVSTRDQASPDSYFYKSSKWNNARVGERNSGDDHAFSNWYYWQVNNGQAGYAFKDLTYKYPMDYDSQRYFRVGEEFQLAKNSIGNPNFVNNNKLYVTYAMKVEGIDTLAVTDTLAQIGFTYRGTDTDSTFTVIVRHNSSSGSADVSYITKSVYTNSPFNTTTGIHFITVDIPISELLTKGAIDTTRHNAYLLKNVNPTLYWNGHGTLKLDYIDYQDEIYKNYTNQGSQMAHLRTYANSANVPYLMTLDEPGPGQFAAFKIIQDYLAEIAGAPELITPVHMNRMRLVKR